MFLCIFDSTSANDDDVLLLVKKVQLGSNGECVGNYSKLPTFLLAARLVAWRFSYVVLFSCYVLDSFFFLFGLFCVETIKQDYSLSIMYTCRDAGRSMIAFRQSTCEKYTRPFEAATLIPMSGYAIESPLHVS